jgi:branched-chain amino acid transport system permease protein
MVILGGLGSIWGVVIGAVVLSLTNTWLIPHEINDVIFPALHINFDATQITSGLFGFVLVAMMVLRPQGLLPERRREMELTEGVGIGAPDAREVTA